MWKFRPQSIWPGVNQYIGTRVPKYTSYKTVIFILWHALIRDMCKKNKQTTINDNSWLQGQDYPTNIADKNYLHTELSNSDIGTPYYFHTELSTSDIGTPYYFHTKLWNWHVFQLWNESFNRNSESNAPHYMSESTDMTTISTCFVTCMLYCTCVCVRVPVHKAKWRQYVLRFHKYNISLDNQTGLTNFIHQIVVDDVSWKQFFSDMPMHYRSKQTTTPLWRFFRLPCTILEFTSQTDPEMAVPVQGSYKPS